MSSLADLAARWGRSARPRWTVRLRLTLVYGALFLVSGVALLSITYVLVKQDIGDNFGGVTQHGPSTIFASGSKRGVTFGVVPNFARDHKEIGFAVGGMEVATGPNGNTTVRIPLPKTTNGKAPSPAQIRAQLTILRSEAEAVQSAELHQLLFDSGVALVAMALLSVLLGWLLAGRVLRPLRVITSKAQDISATNLHERIALQGPDDEMVKLGATFDDLLARLERAFDAQRQFVANASHELRTPLARQRTLLEVAAADPDADVSSLRAAAAKAISAGEEQERLIEALLTLASSERGLDDRAAFDLGAVVGDVVESRRPEAALRGVRMESSISRVPATGNLALAERLVGNLVENALRHNEPDGWVLVSAGADDGHAVVDVTNSGPAVPADEVDRLFEPFQRLSSGRISREGHGLGLSIVRAVAAAHGATISAQSRPGGGLRVRVGFPLDAVLPADAALPVGGPISIGPPSGETVDAGSPPTGD